MRLIDADALKELFREVIGRIAKRPDINFNMEHMIRASAMVIEMINDAPSVTPESHWIPVTERLPENEKRVLILNDDNLYMIGFIREYDCWNEWRYQYEMYDDDVYEEKEHGKIVAWMPLPEPYKGVTT